jgi:hypothetical protein
MSKNMKNELIGEIECYCCDNKAELLYPNSDYQTIKCSHCNSYYKIPRTIIHNVRETNKSKILSVVKNEEIFNGQPVLLTSYKII